MTQQLRLFFIALQFLTRVPVPAWVGYRQEWLNQSARWFALVGLAVGVLAAAVLMLAAMVFPPAVAVGLSIAATVFATGAFHEDGWADTCDALGGAVGRERALEIMKDSRIGAYGAIGLVLMLGLKAAVLTAMPLALAVPASLLAHTASRAAAVALMRWLPYAGDLAHAKAKPLAQQVGRVELAVAAGTVLLLVAALLMSRPAQLVAIVIGLVLLCLGTLWCAAWLLRRLGGFTGDGLGATQQLSELLMLMGWLASMRLVGVFV